MKPSGKRGLVRIFGRSEFERRRGFTFGKYSYVGFICGRAFVIFDRSYRSTFYEHSIVVGGTGVYRLVFRAS